MGHARLASNRNHGSNLAHPHAHHSPQLSFSCFLASHPSRMGQLLPASLYPARTITGFVDTNGGQVSSDFAVSRMLDKIAQVSNIVAVQRRSQGTGKGKKASGTPTTD